MTDYLSLEDVFLSYHTEKCETEALGGVTFGIKRGEFLAIVGPSGCGKTTVLSAIAGLLKPTAGKITLDGSPVSEPANVGYMLQRDTLFEWLTIEENVTLGLRIKKTVNSESMAYARQLLNKYGLSDFVQLHPEALSGGMRQRVALIRTLAFRPKVLLLDEPFSALDYQTRLDVAEDVRNIINNEGITTLLVTHDIAEACSLGDRIAVFSPRPTKVKKIFDVHFHGSPSERRKQTGFSVLTEDVWATLKE